MRSKKKLASTLVISYALAVNEKFKVLWTIGYQPHGVLGEMWENGYIVFSRAYPAQTYAQIHKQTLDKFIEVQQIHRKMIASARNIMESLSSMDPELRGKVFGALDEATKKSTGSDEEISS